jgi:hypothetical protein
MDDKTQMQYHLKITNALSSIFEEESENYINVFDENFSMNDFIHVLATRAPQMIVIKLTSEEFDPLEFNHLCNKLIMQDRVKNN